MKDQYPDDLNVVREAHKLQVRMRQHRPIRICGRSQTDGFWDDFLQEWSPFISRTCRHGLAYETCELPRADIDVITIEPAVYRDMGHERRDWRGGFTAHLR